MTFKNKKFIKTAEKIIEKHYNKNGHPQEKKYVVVFTYFDWKLKFSKFKQEFV